MNDKELDRLFEKMSRECANKMNGTRPRPQKKKTVKKTNKRK